MKYSRYIAIVFLLALLPFMNSCKDETASLDTTPPKPITNVEFTALNGGGYFTYTIPEDEDFLYVRGEYMIDNGSVISKTSSVYADTLFIEGLGQVKEYEVKLYSVDRDNNHSQPVIQRITPCRRLRTMRPYRYSLVFIHRATGRMNAVLTVQIFVRITVGDRTVSQDAPSNLLRIGYHTQLECRTRWLYTYATLMVTRRMSWKLARLRH